MAGQKRLGMGLDALLGGGSDERETPRQSPGEIDITSIHPNPFQPRSDFDENEIRQLSQSIRRQGVLQPILVRPVGSIYQLVAGERRWRAAKMAGLDRIPAVVRPVNDQRMLEMALVENLQRKDLNPLEKARAFKRLLQLNNWTQEEVADSVGMGRPTVANFLRLLDLPVEIQEAVSRGTITMGHARALLAVPKKGLQMQLLRQTLKEDLSVRVLEKLTQRKPGKTPGPESREPWMEDMERKLMDRLGSRVKIERSSIVISFATQKELGVVLQRLGVA